MGESNETITRNISIPANIMGLADKEAASLHISFSDFVRLLISNYFGIVNFGKPGIRTEQPVENGLKKNEAP